MKTAPSSSIRRPPVALNVRLLADEVAAGTAAAVDRKRLRVVAAMVCWRRHGSKSSAATPICLLLWQNP